MLTELNILTPSIEQQIYQLLKGNREQLVLTNTAYNHSNDNKLTDENRDRYAATSIYTDEKLAMFNQYVESTTSYFTSRQKVPFGEFNTYKLPDDLELEIFNQLPIKLQTATYKWLNCQIRLQVTTDGDYLLPHADGDTMFASLLTVVSDTKETTWWWRQTQEHEIINGNFPDINRIERVASAATRKGETWLFNIREIHSVEREPNRRSDERVTINFRWANTSMNELLATIL
jgi:hypothetical protein